MKRDIQQRLVELRNELESQKVYSGLAYSSLLLPENTPTKTYSDTINLSGGSDGVVARIRFRFTRTDGLIDTPIINFPTSFSMSPSYTEYAIANGFSISGNDVPSLNLFGSDVVSYIAELGDGYVDFYVDFDNSLKSRFFSLSSLSVSVTVQAISNVVGTLIVERII